MTPEQSLAELKRLNRRMDRGIAQAAKGLLRLDKEFKKRGMKGLSRRQLTYQRKILSDYKRKRLSA